MAPDVLYVLEISRVAKLGFGLYFGLAGVAAPAVWVGTVLGAAAFPAGLAVSVPSAAVGCATAFWDYVAVPGAAGLTPGLAAGALVCAVFRTLPIVAGIMPGLAAVDGRCFCFRIKLLASCVSLV